MNTNVQEAVKVLNRLHSADPSVMQSLIFQRVPCNEQVAKDPTVQVGVEEGQTVVGILGIINGLFGVNSENVGYICADLADDGTVLGFSVNQLRGG